ncbi:MAG: hypothetical protein JKY49_00415 [Cohaesibacteraceae bacterium]|nr:hypothetical protein [Cohaesibacteraceae bacterium]MBL4875761.1 hypothetical protein [Cohaesibacteraceae bacterium]
MTANISNTTAAAATKWVKTKYKIPGKAMQSGKDSRELDAYALGEFVIHRRLDDANGWVVTHATTGSSVLNGIGLARTLKIAKIYAEEMSLIIDWNFEEIGDFKDLYIAAGEPSLPSYAS